MNNLGLLLLVSFLAQALSFGSAYDPSPLQDFCVGIDEPDNAVFVNGKFCKNPKLVNATDFFFSGLNIRRNTSNPLGSTVTPVFEDQLRGLNTLGISMVRIDYGIDGVNPPHAHPRASEILVVLEGTLFVGFINSNPESRLFAEVLHPGDVFIFPIGMIHFQLNIGKTNAVAIAALSSQNPGIITIANAIFNSNPRNNPKVLARAFQLDVQVVEELQKKFWYYNS